MKLEAAQRLNAATLNVKLAQKIAAELSQKLGHPADSIFRIKAAKGRPNVAYYSESAFWTLKKGQEKWRTAEGAAIYVLKNTLPILGFKADSVMLGSWQKKDSEATVQVNAQGADDTRALITIVVFTK